MSGIYIPCVNMPTERESFNLTIKYNGTVFDTETGMQVAEACELPPHGRLIDADALMHEFEKSQRTMAQHGREYSCSFMSSSQEISTEWYCVEDMLENAPTIIEAEEGET